MTRQLTGRSYRFDPGELKVRFTFDSPPRAASWWCTVRGSPLTVTPKRWLRTCGRSAKAST
ncbi:hypothetical protein GCM10027073_25920 [Streptomyces chlorus]